MQLEPYIFFYGRCEEALAFYKSVFGGEYDAQPMQDAPNRVMHATFKGPGFQFMASDGQGEKAVNPQEGNIALSIGVNDKAEGEKIFNALAAGGNVNMPFGPAFWGGNFGVLTDKFGTEWMISSN
jgi:PhnB protein